MINLDLSAKLLSNLAKVDLPVISVDTPAVEQGIPSVSIDNRVGACAVMKHLAQHGQGNIAIFAKPYALSDEQLLSSVQRATFRYFRDYGHEVSGLTRERYAGKGYTCSSGGTGFGLLAIMVGVERGFITREQGIERLLKIAKFLGNADRYHGAWSHWMNGCSGKTIRFTPDDDGGDIVETALLMQGLLTVRQYSFICFDPRGKRDEFTNYFDNSRAISLINRAYCKDNPGGFKGYSDIVWGVTACDGPDGYSAFAPGKKG